MVNVPWTSTDQLRDVESLNFVANCRRTKADEAFMWDAIHRKARDNARTPMPWDNSENGGFTTGTPWIMLNPDYPEINVAAARRDADSVLHFYRRLIAMRKDHLIMPYGEFRLLWPDDLEVFAYTKSLGHEHWLIAANFSENVCEREWPEEAGSGKALILSNVDRCALSEDGKLCLAPYEAVIIQCEQVV